MGILDRFHVLDADHVPDHPAPDGGPQGQEIRRIAEHMADADDPAGLQGLVADGLALFLGLGDRLFQQDVIAQVQGLHAGLVMAVVRGGDDHDIREFLSAGEYFPEMAETHLGGHAMGIAEAVFPMVQNVRNADDFHGLREHLGIARIDVAPVAAADDDDRHRAAGHGFKAPDLQVQALQGGIIRR